VTCPEVQRRLNPSRRAGQFQTAKKYLTAQFSAGPGSFVCLLCQMAAPTLRLKQETADSKWTPEEAVVSRPRRRQPVISPLLHDIQPPPCPTMSSRQTEIFVRWWYMLNYGKGSRLGYEYDTG